MKITLIIISSIIGLLIIPTLGGSIAFYIGSSFIQQFVTLLIIESMIAAALGVAVGLMVLIATIIDEF